MQTMSELPAGRTRLGRAATAARHTLRWTLLGIGLLILLPVVALVLIATFEISISAGPWRDRIGEAASEALGRRVALEGPLELVPSLRPVQDDHTARSERAAECCPLRSPQ